MALRLVLYGCIASMQGKRYARKAERSIHEGLGLPVWTSSSGMRTKRSPGADSRLARDASDSAYCCRFATTNTNEEYGS
jgi:hypothetical protein